MGKMKDALRKLGFKVNGKTPSGDSTAKIIDDIAENYEGGSGGTEVVANPTLDGTESNLTGLEVNGVKYAVPQGSGGGVDLFNHSLILHGNRGSAFLTILSPESNNFNYYSLAEYIMAHGNPFYEGEVGEETPPDYWLVGASGVIRLSQSSGEEAMEEDPSNTNPVPVMFVKAYFYGSGEEQDFQISLVAIDGNEDAGVYNIEDRVTPMNPSNNQEEETPVEEGPATEE